MNRWEIEKKVAIKAIKDPAFRKKVMSDPMHAIHEIDKSFKRQEIHVRVLEEKQNEWILAIPHYNQGYQNMSEKELENLFAADCQGTCLHTM